MKRLLIVFAVVLLITTVVWLIPKPGLHPNQVVKIQVESQYGEWQGSGVFVANDLILTAGHVVDGAKKVTITFSDGKIHRAYDWYKETEVDLGVVAIRTLEVEPTATFTNAVVGEDVWMIGNPYRVFPILTKGIISAIDVPDIFAKTKNMIITDCPANAGNSGSPLFNKNGDILGIFTWHFTDNTEGMNYCVRAEVCKLTLRKYHAIKVLEKIK